MRKGKGKVVCGMGDQADVLVGMHSDWAMIIQA